MLLAVKCAWDGACLLPGKCETFFQINVHLRAPVILLFMGVAGLVLCVCSLWGRTEGRLGPTSRTGLVHGRSPEVSHLGVLSTLGAALRMGALYFFRCLH